MILLYLLIALGSGIGLWGVVDLAWADHLLESASLLILLVLVVWACHTFVRRAPFRLGLAFVGASMGLLLELAGHMNGGRLPQSPWVWIYFYGALAGGPFYLDLVTRFPAPQPRLRWLPVATGVLCVAVGVLGPMGLIGSVFEPMHPLAIAGREAHYQGGGHTLHVMSSALLMMGCYAIGVGVAWFARQRSLAAGDARTARQALIMVVGNLLTFVPSIPFLPDLVPDELELILHGPPAIFFATLPLSVAIALRHPDLFDERGLFRRGLIGLTTMSIDYLLYVLQVRILTHLMDQVRPGFAYEPAVFGAAIIVAMLHRPIQTWVTDQIDRLFFPHLLGFRTLLQEASQALATTIIPADLHKLATEILPARLGAPDAALLVLDQIGADLLSLAGTPLTLSPKDAVWKKAYQADGPTLLANPADCTQFGLTAPALMLPLRVGGRLVGLYLLGARRSGINYTRDELTQLKVLGNHLAVAVENGRALRKIDELSQRALAEVAERNQIAREIHDTIAQGLTAASLQLEVVEATLTANPARAEKAAARAQQIVRENLAEARRSVLELRAPLLGAEALPAALSRLLNQAASDIGATGSFQIEGTYRGLPARIENQLYRIAQEALHNAVKYSSASHLTVSLGVDPECVFLRISDDGAGFDPDHLAPGNSRGGFGLTGMGERTRLLGGRLRIVSEPGEGTLVEAVVPLDEREGEVR